jgi:hypothetical protein
MLMCACHAAAAARRAAAARDDERAHTPVPPTRSASATPRRVRDDDSVADDDDDDDGGDAGDARTDVPHAGVHLYRIAYSLHSSFAELWAFVEAVQVYAAVAFCVRDVTCDRVAKAHIADHGDAHVCRTLCAAVVERTKQCER